MVRRLLITFFVLDLKFMEVERRHEPFQVRLWAASYFLSPIIIRPSNEQVAVPPARVQSGSILSDFLLEIHNRVHTAVSSLNHCAVPVAWMLHNIDANSP